MGGDVSFLFFFLQERLSTKTEREDFSEVVFKLYTEAVCIFRKQQNIAPVVTVNANLILRISHIEGILLLDAFNLIIAQKSAPSIPQRFMINQSAFIQDIFIVRRIKSIIADHKEDQQRPCDDTDLKQRVKGYRQYGYENNGNDDKIHNLLTGAKVNFPLIYLLLHGLPAPLVNSVRPQIKYNEIQGP